MFFLHLPQSLDGVFGYLFVVNQSVVIMTHQHHIVNIVGQLGR